MRSVSAQSGGFLETFNPRLTYRFSIWLFITVPGYSHIKKLHLMQAREPLLSSSWSR